jgi:hypothetical protein
MALKVRPLLIDISIIFISRFSRRSIDHTNINPHSQAISSKDAAALDKDLIDINVGGFSLDQLMELAGLSVSQAGTVQYLRPF